MKIKNAVWIASLLTICFAMGACSSDNKKGSKGRSGVDGVSVAKIGGEDIQLCATQVDLVQLREGLKSQIVKELEVSTGSSSPLSDEEFFDIELLEILESSFLRHRAVLCRKEKVTQQLNVNSAHYYLSPISSLGWSGDEDNLEEDIFQIEETRSKESSTKLKEPKAIGIPRTALLSLNKSQFLTALSTGKIQKSRLILNPKILNSRESDEASSRTLKALPSEISISPLTLLLSDLVLVNQSDKDLSAKIIAFFDSSILTDDELRSLVRYSLNGWRNGRILDRGFGLYSSYWSQSLKREPLQNLQKSDLGIFRSWIGVDGINRLVFEKKYANLKALATASNVNAVSYHRRKGFSTRSTWQYGNRLIQLTDEVSTYGLSPLMVAAILKDDKAIEILKSVEGVRLDLQSPMLLGVVWRDLYNGSISLKSLSNSQSTWGGSGSIGYGSSGSGYSSGGTGGGAGSSGGRASFQSQSVNRPEQLAQQRCPGCTALMVAINEGHCAQIHTLVEKDVTLANQKHRDGRSPIEFSLGMDQRCLVDLVQNGSTFVKKASKISEQMGAIKTILLSRSNEVFRAVPEKEWKSLSHAQTAYLAAIEFGPHSQSHPAVFSRMQAVKIVNKSAYYELFDDYLKTIIDRTSRKYTINPVAKFTQMKALGYDPNRAVGQKYGLSIFDFFLLFRGSEVAVTNNKPSHEQIFELNEFEETLDKILQIEPKWLNDWVNGQSFFGYNPVSLLAAYNEKYILRTLAKKIPGFDPDIRCKKSGYTALDWSIMRMNFTEVRAFGLLENDPFPITIYGNSMWKLLVNELAATETLDFEKGKELKPEVNSKFVEITGEFAEISQKAGDEETKTTPFFINWWETREE